MSNPRKLNDRALELIGLAIRYYLDSFDLEEVCKRHGLDYESSPIGEIEAAVQADYGGYVPGCWPALRVG